MIGTRKVRYFQFFSINFFFEEDSHNEDQFEDQAMPGQAEEHNELANEEPAEENGEFFDKSPRSDFLFTEDGKPKTIADLVAHLKKKNANMVHEVVPFEFTVSFKFEQSFSSFS